MPTVGRLSVTPVKSLALHHPTEMRLGPEGVEGDRRFFLLTKAGKPFSGAKYGPLVQIRAEYAADERRLFLRFPDGSVMEDEVVQGDAVEADFFGRPVPAHLVLGPWSQALSAFAGASLRLAECGRPSDAYDMHPLTVVSTASVEELGRHGGDGSRPDPARFRMHIDVDGCRPHEEDTWSGLRVRIGPALVRVGGPVPRCVVTTQDPATGLKDFDTLRVIAAYRGRGDAGTLDFGMYADVVEPGTIRLGDPVELLAD